MIWARAALVRVCDANSEIEPSDTCLRLISICASRSEQKQARTCYWFRLAAYYYLILWLVHDYASADGILGYATNAAGFGEALAE